MTDVPDAPSWRERYPVFSPRQLFRRESAKDVATREQKNAVWPPKNAPPLVSRRRNRAIG